MNSFAAIDKLTKSLAGVLAMLATFAVLGAPLTLAEYYAQASSADQMAASSLAGRAGSDPLRHS